MKKKLASIKPIIRTTNLKSKKYFLALAGKIHLNADSVTALREDSLL